MNIANIIPPAPKTKGLLIVPTIYEHVADENIAACIDMKYTGKGMSFKSWADCFTPPWFKKDKNGKRIKIEQLISMFEKNKTGVLDCEYDTFDRDKVEKSNDKNPMFLHSPVNQQT